MRHRLALAALLALALVLLIHPGQASGDGSAPGVPEAPVWEWPLDGHRTVAEPYRAPAHQYGAGHRGVDLRAAAGAVVRAPADGAVAFRGVVVDRGVLTIEHAHGLVSSYEPISSDLAPGTLVRAGDVVGTLDRGGHALVDTLHLGVRWEGEYINPMLLFGPVPRAVLLPCCDAL
ncbi:M23 family metallopeptidase [Microbacterium sp. 1.5R]|uniref:M23 family metallopeptidase n=1 Tax=Microbacterium sp. 1.5R TaxID=1916917 RepID=UPI0011A43128|nr:M23 family metallopeptidase [Microbacterium sp. 1.5R]